jgi:hypothetical protein
MKSLLTALLIVLAPAVAIAQSVEGGIAGRAGFGSMGRYHSGCEGARLVAGAAAHAGHGPFWAELGIDGYGEIVSACGQLLVPDPAGGPWLTETGTVVRLGLSAGVRHMSGPLRLEAGALGYRFDGGAIGVGGRVLVGLGPYVFVAADAGRTRTVWVSPAGETRAHRWDTLQTYVAGVRFRL